MKSDAIVSLTILFGLLIGSSTSAPVSSKRTPRLAKRDDSPNTCPGTLAGPSGNKYFAFSTKLSNKVAQQACASCYGGVLADVTITELSFIGSNLEQGSWIRSWNGDDYSSSCLTLTPFSGSIPSIGVDVACQSELWPLCIATTDVAQSPGDPTIKVEIDDSATLESLAVPFTPSAEVESVTVPDGQSPDTVEGLEASQDKEIEELAPTKTTALEELEAGSSGPTPPEVTSPRHDEVTVTVDENLKADAVVPPTPKVTSPRHDEVSITINEDLEKDSTGPNGPEITSPRNPVGEEPVQTVEVVTGSVPVPIADQAAVPGESDIQTKVKDQSPDSLLADDKAQLRDVFDVYNQE